MGEKSGKDKDAEAEKINAIIVRQVQSYSHLLDTTKKLIFEMLLHKTPRIV